MPKRQIFVSHAGSDTWVARQIAREITRCGAKPFLDEAEIQAGQDFESEILSFLAKAHELVVLLTPWALTRPYVWAELGAAWQRKIPIVALLHGVTSEQLQKRAGAPVFLKQRNCKTLNDVDGYFAELRSRIKPPRKRAKA